MKEYNFKFTEQEINYVLNTLAKQPYMEVAEIIANIHKQADEQIEKDESN